MKLPFHRLSSPLSTVLLALLTLASASARADVPKICQGKGFAACFQLLLQERCLTYSNNYKVLSKREFRCESSVIDMVSLFSPFQPKDDSSHVVAFPKQIGELITNPGAYAYLRDLPGTIESAIHDGQMFSLWDYTLKRTGQNEELALKWIAVLFQDTHPDENIVLDQARVNYGTKTERKMTPRERDTWEKAIQALSFDRLGDKSAESDSVFLDSYPKIDSSNLSEGIYHFYFSAYVAKALMTSRKSVTESGIDMNGFAPFLLNTMYEMHIDIDENLSPLKDAKPFSEKTKWHSLKDIYTGYMGALYGLGGPALVAKAEPYETFSKRFAADPSGTIRSLYNNFRPKK